MDRRVDKLMNGSLRGVDQGRLAPKWTGNCGVILKSEGFCQKADKQGICIYCVVK